MKVLTFGEVMLRLKTPEHLKILQADTFEANYGGAEANVAVSLATLGDDVSYVTKVPEHQVGQAAVNEIRRFGVNTSRVLRNLYTVEDGDGMGIYLKDGKFYESPVHKVHSFEAVGAGDAFGAGMIHAMLHDFEPQKAIDFAISASVLKLMIQHDANVASETEIEQIMKQGGTNLQR